jgi:hypothetical protein
MEVTTQDLDHDMTPFGELSYRTCEIRKALANNRSASEVSTQSPLEYQ